MWFRFYLLNLQLLIHHIMFKAMKRYLVWLLAAMLLGGSFSGCNKQLGEEKVQNTSVVMEQMGESQLATLYTAAPVFAVESQRATAPSRNPYDYVGAAHNAKLEKVLAAVANGASLESQVGFSGSSPRFDEIKRAISPEEYFQDYPEITGKIKNRKVAACVKGIFRETRLGVENGQIREQRDLELYVISVENRVLSTDQLNEKEKANVLSMASTFRQSSAFWSNRLGNAPFNPTDELMKRKWWQWVLIAAADAAGGFLGAAIDKDEEEVFSVEYAAHASIVASKVL